MHTIKPSLRQRKVCLPIVFLFPLFVVLGLTVFYPGFQAICLSFTRWKLMYFSPPKWIGLSNYVDLLKNLRFYNAIGRTFYFTAMTIGIQILLALGLALLLNLDFKGKTVYRTLLLFPFFTVPLGASLIWRMMFNSEFGIITYFLQLVGLPKVYWLNKEELAIFSVVIAYTWRWVSYSIIILLSGLYSLPETPFEAAKIDGASRLQSFLYITLPLLRLHIGTVLILQGIRAFKVFDIIWGLTEGGPARSTETLYPYTYIVGFRSFHMGQGAAIGVIFLLIIFGMTLISVKWRKIK